MQKNVRNSKFASGDNYVPSTDKGLWCYLWCDQKSVAFLANKSIFKIII